MRSRDLDAFLTWGRLEAGALRLEAFDDDSGGGTDAQLEVTVSRDGGYAIRTHSYAGGEIGAYSLSVSRAGSRAPDSEATSAGAGSWVYGYGPATDPGLETLAQRVRQRRTLEGVVSRLNEQFPTPRNVTMRVDQCGGVGAFYDPARNLVVLCYEMLAELEQTFAADGDWSVKQHDAIDGAISFILMHEVGHALVDVLDLPITGREEDAVDQLATLLMLETGEKGTRAALSGILAIQPEPGEQIGHEDYAGVHALSPQRLYNVICWIYATDPLRYGPLVNPFLPSHRMGQCPAEYARFSRAWARLLEPHRVR